MFIKIKTDASTEKANQAAFSKRILFLIVSYLFLHTLFRQRPESKMLISSFQRGSILIGIIVTMVVMAVLGTGMLYLTTTSTFNELIYGSHSEAYFVAESGGRYAKAVIRDAYANDKTKLNTINANQVFTLSNGNSFQIRDWVLQSGNPDTITFSSIGVVGSGFMKAERLIAYRVQPANQTGGGGYTDAPALPPAVSGFNKPSGGSDAAWLGQYFTPTANNETKIFHINGNGALNLAAECYTMGLKWYANTSIAQFDTIRTANDGLLSYKVQVKIYVPVSSLGLYNILGISFRLDDGDNSSIVKDNMYGLSFVKITKPAIIRNSDPVWYKEKIYTNNSWDVFSTGSAADKWFVVLWKRTGVIDGDGCGTGTYTPLAYKALTRSDGACLIGDSTSCSVMKLWPTLYLSVEEKKASNSDPYSYPLNTIYNEIKCYLPNYTRSASPTWDDTNLISWTTVTGSAIPSAAGNSVVADSSLTTKNYNSYTSTTNPKAAEIGLHIFSDSNAARVIFYDNFFIDLSPSISGGSDGSGTEIQY